MRGAFRTRPGMAISIETTPLIATATAGALAGHEPDKIHALREMGIERISMGVQTTHLALARALGRDMMGWACYRGPCATFAMPVSAG